MTAFLVRTCSSRREETVYLSTTHWYLTNSDILALSYGKERSQMRTYLAFLLLSVCYTCNGEAFYSTVIDDF